MPTKNQHINITVDKVTADLFGQIGEERKKVGFITG